MQKLVYHVASSIDGHIAGADGSFDCFLNDPEHVPDFLKAIESRDIVLMGQRLTKSHCGPASPHPYPRMESYLFSQSLKKSPDPRVTLIEDDPPGFVAMLKERPGRGIWLCGGGELAGILLQAGLIDEIVLKLNPLVIGDGTPLFAGVSAAQPDSSIE